MTGSTVDLTGKVALVTGSSRGIGAAVAHALAAAGVKLGLGSRSGDDLGIAGAVAHPTDVRDPEQVEALVAATVEAHGRLDIVVANAGVGAYGPFLELHPDELERMIDVNLKGVLYTARATLGHLIEGGGGDFVSLASVAGVNAFPGEAVYNASKFGQVGFVRSLDIELRSRGVRCSNICPGGVATDFAIGSGREAGHARARRDDEPRGRRRGRAVRAHAAAFDAPDDDDVSPDERGLVGLAVRWGVLSTARIGGALIAAARGSDAADVVAVASRSEAPAQAFAQLHGIPRAHGSYEALLADPDVEAVYVPLPNAMHVDWTLQALRAGKHVLCEKPMDRRPERVAAAFDAAEAAGLVLSEAYMYRHNPQTAALGELLGAGAIGDVRLVRASFSFALAGDGDVRLDPALDGGALMDVGCYCVSAARLVAGGEPVSVSAEVVSGPTGVDMRMAALLRFEGDVLATIDCGFDIPARDELEVAGSEGRVLLDDPWHARRPRIVLERGIEREVIKLKPVDSYRLELEDMAAAIAGERAPLLGREDAIGQARAIDALYRSAAEGRAVVLA